MSDTATPEIKTPEFRPVDVLMAHGKVDASTYKGTEFASAREKAEPLLKIRAEGATGRDILGKIKEHNQQGHFNAIDARNLQARFGAGKADVAEDGKLKPPASGEAKELYEYAKKRIDTATSFLQYSDIYLESQRLGKTPDDVIGDRRAKGERGISPDQFKKDREKALDSIVALEGVNELFPDLHKLDPESRRQLIESTLVADPVFHNKVIEKMNRIAESTKNLPEVSRDPELAAAQVEKEEADEQINGSLREIKSNLNDKGIDLDDTELAFLQKAIKEGKSVDYLLAYLNTKHITDERFPHRDIFDAYEKYKNDLPILNAKVEALMAHDARIKVEEDFRKGKQEELNRLQGRLTELQAEVDANKTEYNHYNLNVSSLSLNRDASGQFYTSQVANELKTAVDAARKYKEADALEKKKSPDGLKQEKLSEQNRLSEESNLTDKLDGVFSDAIVETLEARYDELIKLDRKKQEKEAEELKETVSKETQEKIKLLNKRMDEQWIHHDEGYRRKEIDRGRIGDDIRFLAYHGEDGIRQLILRDLGFKYEKEVIDKKGVKQEVTVTANEYTDIDNLSDTQKQILNEVYTSRAQDYKTKLFRDFFAARTLWDKSRILGSHAALGLKSHKWQLLDQHYGEDLKTQVSTTESGAKILADLEQKGIKPTFPLLLMLLLGVPWAVGKAAQRIAA